MSEEEREKRTWTEEIEVGAQELVGRVKELVQEGNVRRLIIREPDGDLVLEIPLTAGVVAGGALAVFAPLLAALGALAALLSRVTLEIVRVEGEE